MPDLRRAGAGDQTLLGLADTRFCGSLTASFFAIFIFLVRF
jgi:hypothetical protein